MKPIYYQSSEGEIVNLIEPPYMMLTDTDLLNYEWTPITAGTNNPYITKLKKQMVSPPFSIEVSGSNNAEMMDNLENLTSVFDRDCYLEQEGRLYIGNFYRECLITKSTKGKVFEVASTVIQFVATSDEPDWRYDKEIKFSGVGYQVGEIASSALVSSYLYNETIEVTPNTDNTIQLKFNDPYYSLNRYNWLQFDLGTSMNIGEFSGLYLHGDASPIMCDVQISDGTKIDESRSISATVMTPTDKVDVDGFTEITIDSFGESGWQSAELIMYCFVNDFQEDALDIKTSFVDNLGVPIDVSSYDYVKFLVSYSSGTTSVNYTVNVLDWETLENISIRPGSTETVEVVVSNKEWRYLRLKGRHLGEIDDSAVSIVSDEIAPDRDMLELGYALENLTLNIDEVHDNYVCELTDTSTVGYINFDDVSVTLKRIYCGVGTGKAIVQGYTDNAWTDILTLNVGNSYDETYNDDYEQIRLKVERRTVLTDAHIMVQTNPQVYNESYAPSEAVIEISGVPSNPSITINDAEYGANIELASGHKLVIDTKNKTVRDYSNDVTFENVFAYRTEGVFDKIPSGVNNALWSGSATIKIKLDQARSEPKWN